MKNLDPLLRETTLASLRERLRNEQDPQARATLAKQCRELRGHGALFPKKEGNEEDDCEAINAVELAAVRAEMSETTDPVRRGILAVKARELRGHVALFSEPEKQFLGEL